MTPTLFDLPGTTALAQWYGSARMIADEIGPMLAGCKWIGVPFAGGMCELARFDARTMLVNDLHKHVINLARVAADTVNGPQLYRRLRRLAHHVDELADAQARCAANDHATPLDWAVDYFVCTWMAHGGSAGTPNEFKGGLSFRCDANGGDSAKRFRSATSSLIAWRRVLARCSFLSMDAIEFIKDHCKDLPGHGVYCDPPFPDGGERYANRFSVDSHREIAGLLGGYAKTRVVIRYYDHPLVRELYPQPRWTWRHIEGRKRTNKDAPEVLIANGGGA